MRPTSKDGFSVLRTEVLLWHLGSRLEDQPPYFPYISLNRGDMALRLVVPFLLFFLIYAPCPHLIRNSFAFFFPPGGAFNFLLHSINRAGSFSQTFVSPDMVQSINPEEFLLESAGNLGAVEVATFLRLALYGVSLSQGYTYFKRSKNDRFSLKLMVRNCFC